MKLETFDKNLKRIGVLTDATDITRKRRLNSDYELSFLVPMTSDDYKEKIVLKGHVQDERGQYYVINRRRRIRDGRKLTSQITAFHVMFKLADFKIPYSSYIAESYGTPIQTLTGIISNATGGKFTFEIDKDLEIKDVKDWGRGNALQALNDIIKIYGCEVEPDNFKIYIKKKIGADNGLQYRIGKNIVASNFKDDVGSLSTRMFAQMKDGRTFIGMDASHLTAEERGLLEQVQGAIVNGKLAVNYLISPHYTYWANDTNTFYDGELIKQDIEDPLELLAATRIALRESEVPKLEVSLSAADLFKIDETEPIPSLGETVTCVDPELGLDGIKARIVELTEFPYSMENHTQVTVANVMFRDYGDIIADLERSKRVVDNIFSGGKVRTGAFETFAQQVIADIVNSKTELIYPPEGGILAQDKTNPLRQVRLTSAGLGISTDGWKTVRSAMTADGVIAERVVGQLGNFVSLLLGEGNNVLRFEPYIGLWSGHADYNNAPFRVDMQGNVVANKLTANNAIIIGSSFVGGVLNVTTDINVGNKVILNANSVAGNKGIVFNDGGSTYAKIDVLSGDMSVNTSGYVILSGSSGTYINNGLTVNGGLTANGGITRSVSVMSGDGKTPMMLHFTRGMLSGVS